MPGGPRPPEHSSRSGLLSKENLFYLDRSGISYFLLSDSASKHVRVQYSSKNRWIAFGSFVVIRARRRSTRALGGFNSSAATKFILSSSTSTFRPTKPNGT